MVIRGGVTKKFSEMRGPNKIFGPFCKINGPNILFGPFISENSIVTPPIGSQSRENANHLASDPKRTTQ